MTLLLAASPHLSFSGAHCFCCVCVAGVCVSLLQIDDKVLPNRCCNRNSKPFEIIILSWAVGVHKARRVQIARCRPERENQENQTFPNLMEQCSSVRRFIHSLKLFYCRKFGCRFFLLLLLFVLVLTNISFKFNEFLQFLAQHLPHFDSS